MAASRVAVVGSCVTRDAWTGEGGAPRKPDLFVARASLASLSLPAEGRNALEALEALADRAGAQRPFVARLIDHEIRKTAFLQLAALQPDVLVVDCIDERFDLLACGDILVNESLELLESGLVAHAPLAEARRIPRLSDEAWSAWQAGLVRLRRMFDDGRMTSTRVALHVSFWAEEIITDGERSPLPENSQLLPGRQASRAAHNALLGRMHDAFTATFPEAATIAPPAVLRVADASHRWGPAPFHYIPEYYEAFTRAAAESGSPLWTTGVEDAT